MIDQALYDQQAPINDMLAKQIALRGKIVEITVRRGADVARRAEIKREHEVVDGLLLEDEAVAGVDGVTRLDTKRRRELGAQREVLEADDKRLGAEVERSHVAENAIYRVMASHQREVMPLIHSWLAHAEKTVTQAVWGGFHRDFAELPMPKFFARYAAIAEALGWIGILQKLDAWQLAVLRRFSAAGSS
jgi:hypothetical protein